MNACMERSKQRMFVKELETVSGSLAVWAQEKMSLDNWSLEDVKLQIRNAARVIGKEI